MTNSNSIIKEAFIKARDLRLEGLPCDEAIQWIPSEKYKRKMEKLVRQERRFYWPVWNTSLKRVAVVLALITMLTGCAMSVPVIREKVVHFFIEITQEGTHFYTPDRASESIVQEYKLTAIPDEYELQCYDRTDSVVYSLWVHSEDEKKVINFIQSIQSSNIFIDTEGVELVTIDVNGNTGYMVTKDGQTAIVWSDEYHEFTLVCPTEIDYRVLLDSIEVVE